MAARAMADVWVVERVAVRAAVRAIGRPLLQDKTAGKKRTYL